ncbi:MAG: dihydrolipoamide acetyltransferase family protein [Nocardioides sp.]
MARYLLPDVGEGLTEADIVRWRVAVGDTVAINDIVVEIETAKSLVELPSPFPGVVRALLVSEGQTVPVGTAIIEIDEPGQVLAEMTAASLSGSGSTASGSTESGPAESGPDNGTSALASPGAATLVGYGPAEAATRRRLRRRTAGPPAGPPTPEPPAASQSSTQVLASPPIRLLAKELGVDLRHLQGTGPGGVITIADVRGAGPDSVGPDSAGPDSAGPERRESIRGVRKKMAAAMVSSAFSAPHVSVWVTADVTGTMLLTERLKTEREFADVRVSPLLIVARACLEAIGQTPEINSVWDEAAGEVVFKEYVNLGIAAATPRGLVVPNIKGAHRMSLPELGAALDEVALTARAGRTTPTGMTGGTFTITNVGVFGVDGGTPIINPGESAILALGAVRKRPWVVSAAGGDALAIRRIATLALSFDHRHIDGAMGCRFLSDVAALLADPSSLVS